MYAAGGLVRCAARLLGQRLAQHGRRRLCQGPVRFGAGIAARPCNSASSAQAPLHLSTTREPSSCSEPKLQSEPSCNYRPSPGSGPGPGAHLEHNCYRHEEVPCVSLTRCSKTWPALSARRTSRAPHRPAIGTAVAGGRSENRPCASLTPYPRPSQCLLRHQLLSIHRTTESSLGTASLARSQSRRSSSTTPKRHRQMRQ